MLLACDPLGARRRFQHLTLLAAVAFLLTLGACRPQLPTGIIGEGKMERILYDFHTAQGIAENITPDSGSSEAYRYELIQAVYRKHHITEDEFERSMNYYCSDLQRLHRIYRNLERRFERETAAFGQANVHDVYADLSADGDTANVWGGRPVMVIRSDIHSNLLSWRQECDSTWLPGDELMWRFMPIPFSSRCMRDLVVDLVVQFTNDSVRGSVRHTSPITIQELRVANPEGWTPKSISGHIYTASTATPQDLAVIGITQIMLVRFHTRHAVSQEVAVTDSLLSDSIHSTSIVSDSLSADSADLDDRRLSPDEFRRQQSVDQKIDVVKEKPYKRQQGRRRVQQPHLIQRKR